ncbi:hypothetical protein MLD38_010596 [Melastoma candidum]|uniref:Uncharacterized protein n=1 Tax=Melastoma candidum TaxID=119954 RepID=A0ACB9R0D9_9MYRT|nr:hypothetical protein MLD38_010596 [Melastoma candidum]
MEVLDLLKCNVTEKYDWSAGLYVKDWIQESKQGYRQSNLQDQCTHRYKVYIDGCAWSVSKKYIMASGSRFIFNELKVDYVYDYMLHLLNVYVKLLRFKPRMPRGAAKVCARKMGRLAKGKYRKYMEFVVNDAYRDRVPCSLPAELDH